MKTHQQALDIAGDYDNLSDKIQAYLKERGLVAVPYKATIEMLECMPASGYTEQFVWESILDAAPNPFEGEE